MKSSDPIERLRRTPERTVGEAQASPTRSGLGALLLSAILVLAGAAATSPAPAPALQSADTLERLAASATRAVVLVEVRTPARNRQGSGFLVDPSGRILTNYHVVRGASGARVKLASGDVYDRVRVLATDERRDIAVLQISGFDLPALALGNSDSVRIGAPVVHIGSPLGLENTVTTGIVSARRREGEGYELLQVSAPASTGSSGGPVLARNGEVVGIAVSQMQSGQNLNFAVPINYARGLLEHLDRNPVAVLEPESSESWAAGSPLSSGAEGVNRGLAFRLDGFRGYRVEREGTSGSDEVRRTRITYRRIETVGGGPPRIERYAESETTEKTRPFGTPEIVRRERSRTIVSADDLRPVSARGETAWRRDGEWRRAEYDLHFDGYRVRGVIRDTVGGSTELDRELPSGVILRPSRNLAFSTLDADSLMGRSVELVTFDPWTGELAKDRFDVRGADSVRIAGRTYRTLRVNVASGLANATAYFRLRRPRVLLRREDEEAAEREEVTHLEEFPPREATSPGGSRAEGGD